jgi:hypothetical protein
MESNSAPQEYEQVAIYFQILAEISFHLHSAYCHLPVPRSSEKKAGASDPAVHRRAA